MSSAEHTYFDICQRLIKKRAFTTPLCSYLSYSYVFSFFSFSIISSLAHPHHQPSSIQKIFFGRESESASKATIIHNCRRLKYLQHFPFCVITFKSTLHLVQIYTHSWKLFCAKQIQGNAGYLVSKPETTAPRLLCCAIIQTLLALLLERHNEQM